MPARTGISCGRGIALRPHEMPVSVWMAHSFEKGRVMRRNETPEGQSIRVLRMGEQVRHALSEVLMRGDVHDSTLAATVVSITEVRMSPDLRHATAFVKALGTADEAVVLKALRTNTAYLQSEVAHRVNARFAAKLRFLSDESFDEGGRIYALLRKPQVARDLGETDGEA